MFNPIVIEDTGLDAESIMEKIGVSDEGKEIMSPKSRFIALKLEKVPLKTAILLKQEALAVGMDCALPWCAAGLKCDEMSVLLFGTLKQFRILIEKMKLQPFKGKTLASEIHESIENYLRNEYIIQARDVEIKIPPVKIMGILNVTPDSFYDGGKYDRVEKAVEHARKMVENGADIIDVGGESSRPFSEPVSADEEKKRVIPVIEALVDECRVPISIDTYKPEVAKEALKRGAVIVNDIFALRKKGMTEVVKEYDAAVVLMHMKGEPKNMQINPTYEDTISEIIGFLRERAKFAIDKGIPANRIIIDPGIGFGKRLEDNLRIIKFLNAFRTLGYPVLLGASRKSYIEHALGLPVEERLEATIATDIIGVLKGTAILRVHDVREHVRSVRMAEKILGVLY